MRCNRPGMLLILVFFHVIIPIYCVLWVALTPNISQWDWMGKTVISGLYLILLHLAGYWAYITYFLRYLWPILFASAIGFSFPEVKVLPFFVEKGTGTWVMGGLVIALLIYWISLALRSRKYEGIPIALTFPLKNGTYAVLEGGNGASGGMMNYHYSSSVRQGLKADRSMQYAVDIVKINALGRTMKGWLPKSLEKYETFEELLYSPCDGKIVEVVDHWPNEIPFTGDHPYHVGNRVVIQHGDIYILMGHLQQGSILVNVGDEVKAGQPLAKIGNSGWTQSPHLHIQAMKVTPELWEGEGVPMRWDGVFPVRNDLFRR